MLRAPLQILVIPFRRKNGSQFEFAVFHRTDGSMWQFIAGGGEDNETPEEAAVREAREEASIPNGVTWVRLDSMSTVPRSAFLSNPHWPSDLYVVPEHCFAVDVSGHDLRPP